MENSGYADTTLAVNVASIDDCGGAIPVTDWLTTPEPEAVPAGIGQVILSMDAQAAQECEPREYRATLILRSLESNVSERLIEVQLVRTADD